jgi:hypothetical protein
VILHALERDDPIAGRLDDFVEYLEPVALAQTELRQLVLDQPLCRFFQGLLHFPNTDTSQPFLVKAVVYQFLSKKVRLARTSTTERALIASRVKQRLEYLSRWNLKL